MAKEILNEETGVMETVYTAEEMAAKDAQIEEANKIARERGENFSRFNDKVAKTEEELAAMRTRLEEKEMQERTSARNNSAAKFHGNNDELKQKLDSSYEALAGMPEGTPEEIAGRMEAAARLAGINVQSRNPLYTPTYGEAPQQRQNENKEDEFLKSERGQQALKAMGFEEPTNTQ